MIKNLLKRCAPLFFVLWALIWNAGFPGVLHAWNDETHLAIAKAAGYAKWYNATGADMVKMKAGGRESHNHYATNFPGKKVSVRMVRSQIEKYNKVHRLGHLYGAIVQSARDFQEDRKAGKYGHYHLAFCAHYVGDLSQPLHNTPYNAYNKANHRQTDGIINHAVLKDYKKIRIYRIVIKSESDLIREIKRIANLSLDLGRKLERENRMITQAEAFGQISHSASLFKAILRYVGEPK
ncbi:MAG: hypothetical protein JRH15_17485 [Deltaproteobacteria bacterium]|nr:hypothetical protein [Deltaproteobacteria bacterium]